MASTSAKFGETRNFLVQNLVEFYFTLKFHHESKIRTTGFQIFPFNALKFKNKILKNSWKINEHLKTPQISPRFLQNFPKIFNQNFLEKLTNIFNMKGCKSTTCQHF